MFLLEHLYKWRFRNNINLLVKFLMLTYEAIAARIQRASDIYLEIPHVPKISISFRCLFG